MLIIINLKIVISIIRLYQSHNHIEINILNKCINIGIHPHAHLITNQPYKLYIYYRYFYKIITMINFLLKLIKKKYNYLIVFSLPIYSSNFGKMDKNMRDLQKEAILKKYCKVKIKIFLGIHISKLYNRPNK